MWEMVVRSNKWLDDKSPITSVKNNKFSLFSNPVIFQIGPATAQQHYAQKGFLLYSQNIEKCRFCTCSLGSFAHLCLLSLQNDGLSQLLIYDSEECTWVQLCSLLCFCMCRLHSGQLPTSVWGISSHIFCPCLVVNRYIANASILADIWNFSDWLMCQKLDFYFDAVSDFYFDRRHWERLHLSTQRSHSQSSLVYGLCLIVLSNTLLNRPVKEMKRYAKKYTVCVYIIS